jgi:hypothetical protein
MDANCPKIAAGEVELPCINLALINVRLADYVRKWHEAGVDLTSAMRQ